MMSYELLSSPKKLCTSEYNGFVGVIVPVNVAKHFPAQNLLLLRYYTMNVIILLLT